MKIIDSHVHFEVKGHELFSSKNIYIEQYGKENWDIIQQKNAYQKEKWSKAWNFPTPEKTDDDYNVTAQKWLSEMDKNNIEKMIFVTGGNNEILSNIVKISPDRFVGYAHHNPCQADAPFLLEKAISMQGLKGYKI